jgi:hypothetical protein
MRALVFAPLTVLFCAIGLTTYLSQPYSGPEMPLAPSISSAEAKALYGPDTPKGQKLLDRANEILAAMQRFCAEFHLKYVGPTRLSGGSVSFSSYSYARESGVRTIVTFTTDDVTLSIMANNGRLVSYINTAVERCIEYGPHFAPPDQPKLSTREAIEVATRFLNLTPPNRDIRLALPSAKFDHDGYMPTKTGRKTTQGRWYIQWDRLDEENHLFAGEYVTAWFTEGYGPWAFSSHLDTPYHEDPSPIISQYAAEKAARGGLEGVRWAGLGFAAIHLEQSVLCISRLLQGPYDSGEGEQGCLAWSQTFGCELPGPQAGWISYYVTTDAHSAKILSAASGTSIGEREK